MNRLHLLTKIANPRACAWMLSLALVACGDDGGDKTSDTSTGTDPTTDATSTDGTSEPTTSAGESTTTDASGGETTDATDGETTEDVGTTAETTTTMPPLTTGGPCENFLPPIQPETLEPLTVGLAVEIAFTVPGLEDNTSWTLMGDLPPGLEFTAETGVLAGTPSTAGTFEFSLEAGPTMDNPDCPTLPSFTMYELVVQ
ncbi:putative Ig domain-containing protein [Nannocystis punicea]|uniref:Ig domain-containing protein n=1 Tax=Nannocystis punicea TaxID=2995304 RepID=A0ABY7H7G1_9BACT|nr:putative Ig domain-containing protein [Nannocystis poenicansa]WAS95206.1 putative Ig domain-containing protein [Nannocystis poenicansa]